MLDEAIDFTQFSPEELEIFIEEKLTTDQNFKEKYFNFYNDIKSHTINKKQDW